jgi:hypothetical protein
MVINFNRETEQLAYLAEVLNEGNIDVYAGSEAPAFTINPFTSTQEEMIVYCDMGLWHLFEVIPIS